MKDRVSLAAWGGVGMLLLAGFSARAAGFAADQAVVAEWQNGVYYSGKVGSADAKTVEVKWDDGTEPSRVPVDKAFLIPKKDKRPLKAGTLALCTYGGGAKWYDCKITKVTATGAAVAYADGDSGEVGFEGIVVPTGKAAKELAERAKNPGGGGGSASDGGGGGGGGSAASAPASDDGFNPTLHNDDDDYYNYELECGSMTTQSRADHNTTITLSKGCTLKIVGTQMALHGNMQCEIKSGSLSCR